MKTIQYKGCTVATNTDLAKMIADGETEKAAKHYKKIDGEFRKNFSPELSEYFWPKKETQNVTDKHTIST